MPFQLAYPFKIDTHGRLALTDYDSHVEQMIEQLLFTEPGERVNRPTFGCGIMQLVFAGMSEEVLTATNSLIRSALVQWLGDIIQVEAVKVQLIETELLITIQYVVLSSRKRKVAQFSRK